jgi:hypothetical protein
MNGPIKYFCSEAIDLHDTVHISFLGLQIRLQLRKQTNKSVPTRHSAVIVRQLLRHMYRTEQSTSRRRYCMQHVLELRA